MKPRTRHHRIRRAKRRTAPLKQPRDTRDKQPQLRSRSGRPNSPRKLLHFTLEVETALESFDFLNCADTDEEENKDEQQQEDRSQEEEEEKEEGEEEEGDREEGEGDEDQEEKEEEAEEEEEDDHHREKQEEEGSEEEEEDREGRNGEKQNKKEEEDIYSGGSDDDDAGSLDILMEAPEGFRNSDEECFSESQESSVEDVQDLVEIEMPDHLEERGEDEGAGRPGGSASQDQGERPSTPGHLATSVF
ncbi:hypothetical protein D4764_02G0011370 [Takifugu flavidus]|uniref:Uncharacterized protein n=1 Tax=Takifugu flavidus TaxID=433684 RepID=A0A5C6NM27_9TELE|nr:hypothetical protein D4764_02G0011370 [Takifugu flavidus]